VTLHVGLPAVVDDAGLLARLRGLAYAGLGALRLHAARPLPAAVQDGVRALFSGEGNAAHGRGSARRVEVVPG
jgi:hypothetical protein